MAVPIRMPDVGTVESEVTIVASGEVALEPVAGDRIDEVDEPEAVPKLVQRDGDEVDVVPGLAVGAIIETDRAERAPIYVAVEDDLDLRIRTVDVAMGQLVGERRDVPGGGQRRAVEIRVDRRRTG